MLILISPAKKLLPIDKPWLEAATTPVFIKKTDELLQRMKTLSPADLAQLMHISDDLATLNYQRYQSFQYSDDVKPSHGYPSVMLFQGDVYQNLKAGQWDKATIQFSETHLAILSGLYGLLGPLDRIQPYRLEMGTKLANSCGKDLYAFWQTSITEEINKRLESHTNPILVNLASTEYFDSVNTDLLKAHLITIHFKEHIKDQLKVIGIHSKKARGAMANYMLQNRIEDAEKIKQFTLLNYRFCNKSSNEHHFNFVRT